MFNKNRRLIKRLSGHKRFYVDKEVGLEFYWKINSFYDISVLVFSTNDRTYKEFVVDFGSFKAIYEYSDKGTVTPSDVLIKDKNYPFLVTEMRTKNNSILLKNSSTKNWGASILANVSDHALILKRVVFTDKEKVLAVDAIALTKEGSKKLVKVITKNFKKANMELDLKNEGGL